MEDIKRDDWCFACGLKNPFGLKMEFYWEGEDYLCRFTPGKEHQGYDEIMHGGLVSTLLDEVMGRSLYIQKIEAVTARLEVRYRQPTPIGQELVIRGQMIEKRGKIWRLAANITLPDGTVTAEANATMMVRNREVK